MFNLRVHPRITKVYKTDEPALSDGGQLRARKKHSAMWGPPQKKIAKLVPITTIINYGFMVFGIIII